MSKFSLESQELFIEIEERLSKDIKCFYATNGSENQTNEYQVSCDNHVRYLDFYIPLLKKWIEFDEEHHLNEENQKEDLQRENDIRKKIEGINLLRIPITDFVKDKNEVLKRCLNFIFGS